MITAAMKQETYALTRRWFLHLKKEFIGAFFGLFQPLLFLLLGSMFSSALGRSPETLAKFGGADYLSFQTAGILVFTVMSGALAGGIPFMFDKENGFLEKLLATPISRLSLIASRFIYVVTYASLQTMLVLGLAWAMGAHLAAPLLGLPVILLFVLLLCCGFTLLSITLAFVLNSHADFFAVLGFLTIPLLFLSNALVPLDSMGGVMRTIAWLNPLTYGVLGIRAPILEGWTGAAWRHMGTALAGLLAFDALMLWLSVRTFKRHLD